MLSLHEIDGCPSPAKAARRASSLGMCKIKGYSSKVLRTEFPWLKSRLPSLWTNSYFVSTVGGAPLAVIKQYIENQKSV